MTVSRADQSLPTVAVLIIGNEILSGQVADVNLSHIAQKIENQGIQVKEARVVLDHEEEIALAVNELRQKYDYVISTGGIGPTHDDITAAAVAQAFQVSMEEHPDAVTCFVGDEEIALTPAQERMSMMPHGAEIVMNPETRAPGFRIENVFVLAGFPHIMRGMLESVCQQIGTAAPIFAQECLYRGSEGAIAGRLEELQATFPQVQIGSYPFYTDGAYGAKIVFKGRDESAVHKTKESFLKG
ncbi:molybdopterin-binding protein [Alphaproteobacteria bacterium]|nr:molybdopterin-binding protein [Alphaproteobacteria bacterium]